MSFNWTINKHIILPNGHEVDILRRTSADQEEWRQDLLPLKEIPAIWKLRMGNGMDITTIGTLHCLKNDVDHDEYHILREIGAELKISLPFPVTCKLTVWRVDDRLDMLQALARCVNTELSLYAQLGGATILPMILREPCTDEALITARSLFTTGEI